VITDYEEVVVYMSKVRHEKELQELGLIK
jgi:hypothetical protein